jgi:hypothetical protein
LYFAWHSPVVSNHSKLIEKLEQDEDPPALPNFAKATLGKKLWWASVQKVFHNMG